MHLNSHNLTMYTCACVFSPILETILSRVSCCIWLCITLSLPPCPIPSDPLLMFYTLVTTLLSSLISPSSSSLSLTIPLSLSELFWLALLPFYAGPALILGFGPGFGVTPVVVVFLLLISILIQLLRTVVAACDGICVWNFNLSWDLMELVWHMPA